MIFRNGAGSELTITAPEPLVIPTPAVGTDTNESGALLDAKTALSWNVADAPVAICTAWLKLRVTVVSRAELACLSER